MDGGYFSLLSVISGAIWMKDNSPCADFALQEKSTDGSRGRRVSRKSKEPRWIRPNQSNLMVRD